MFFRKIPKALPTALTGIANRNKAELGNMPLLELENSMQKDTNEYLKILMNI